MSPRLAAASPRPDEPCSPSLPTTQTRVDRVNINNSLAMQKLFGTPGWEASLQLVR